MSEQNKAIVGRWFTEFWGNPWNPGCHRRARRSGHPLRVFDARTPPRSRRRAPVRYGVARAAFPNLNFWGTADLLAEDDYVVGRWEGGGTHTGPAFADLPLGSLPASSGKVMRFTGTTVLGVEGKRPDHRGSRLGRRGDGAQAASA